MNILKRLDKHFEEMIMCGLLTGISFIILLQIVMRLLRMSLPWPEELARYFYVWSVFLSLAFTIRKRTILRVDLLVGYLPYRMQRFIEVVLQLVNSVFYSTLAFYSLRVIHFVKISRQTSPALEIPMYVVYVIVPVGFALAAFRALQQIYFVLTSDSSERSPEAAKG